MKEKLRQLSGVIKGAAETTKTWFDPPLTSDAEPLEIREAIIEDVALHVEPVDGGRRMLPFNRVSVVVLAPNKMEKARLEGALGGLRDGVRKRLAEIQCALPPTFEIELRYVKHPRPEWAPEQRLAIDYDSRAADTATATAAVAAAGLTITVLRGEATESTYTLTAPHINIGRTAKPVDGRGRPRLNQVVFVEGADDHSRTVGRAHASIRFDAGRGEYRLFDDGSHNGTRIIRNGTSIEVVPHDPTGVTIRSGDEIELGTAAIRVDIGRAP